MHNICTAGCNFFKKKYYENSPAYQYIHELRGSRCLLFPMFGSVTELYVAQFCRARVESFRPGGQMWVWRIEKVVCEVCCTRMKFTLILLPTFASGPTHHCHGVPEGCLEWNVTLKLKKGPNLCSRTLHTSFLHSSLSESENPTAKQKWLFFLSTHESLWFLSF